jgi:serine/threonine-protein kinase
MYTNPTIVSTVTKTRKAAGRVHDFGVEADTRAFLVMELLEGRTLRDELNASSRLHPSRALHICRGASSAVEAAHRLQLIHRDLKPGNIFLAQAPGESEIVKVLDFGMAKFLAAADAETWTGTTVESRSGVLMGTRGYMSPEQLLGETPAESWDVWALAVVAYEALTGALPFPTHSQSDWRHAVLAGRFTPLSEHLPDASPRLQMFFADSFAFDRTRRAQSAAELYQRLEDASA